MYLTEGEGQVCVTGGEGQVCVTEGEGQVCMTEGERQVCVTEGRGTYVRVTEGRVGPWKHVRQGRRLSNKLRVGVTTKEDLEGTDVSRDHLWQGCGKKDLERSQTLGS